jgi:hypothetical protein
MATGERHRSEEAKMQRDYEIVVFDVTLDEDGLFTATSQQLSGVCVVHRDRAKIIEDMADIIRLWYRRNRGIEVESFWGTSRDTGGRYSVPVFTIPADIAARELRKGSVTPT